jgi:hypothetical protein
MAITLTLDVTEVAGDNARTRSRAWIIVACVFVYIALAVALFWPVLPWNGTRIIAGPWGQGYGDPTQTLWFLDWVPYALRHGLDLYHTNFLNYPGGVALANNTLSPLLGLLAAPVTLATGPVVAFNLLLRLAFASSAVSMFFVLRTWCRWPAAFVGGLVYGFGPYMMGQGQIHLDLVFVPIPPLIMWCIYELLVVRRHRPVVMGAVLGALAGAQALIDPEILALLGIIVVIGLAFIAVRSHRVFRERLRDIAKASASALVAFGVIAGYMLWWLLLAPGHVVGPPQPLTTLQLYRADLLGLIVPTSNQLIAPAALAKVSARFMYYNVTENTTYLGLPLVLLLGGVAVVWRRERVVLVSALLALVALIFSLGSPLTIDNRTTGIPLPEAVLAHLPLLDGVVPARFALVVSLFAAIVLGIGADRLFSMISSRAVLKRGVALAGVLVLAASLVFLIPRAPLVSQATSWPTDTTATLNAIPPGTVVLTYPYTVFPRTEAMYWQATDGMRFRIVGGYAVYQGPHHAGEIDPPLLDPSFVQGFFVTAQNGVSTPYPVPGVGVDAGQALCDFLSYNGVGAVVFWNAGVDPAEVKNLLVATLGSPTRTSANQTLLVWVTGSGSGSGECS